MLIQSFYLLSFFLFTFATLRRTDASAPPSRPSVSCTASSLSEISTTSGGSLQ